MGWKQVPSQCFFAQTIRRCRKGQLLAYVEEVQSLGKTRWEDEATWSCYDFSCPAGHEIQHDTYHAPQSPTSLDSRQLALVLLAIWNEVSCVRMEMGWFVNETRVQRE